MAAAGSAAEGEMERPDSGTNGPTERMDGEAGGEAERASSPRDADKTETAEIAAHTLEAGDSNVTRAAPAAAATALAVVAVTSKVEDAESAVREALREGRHEDALRLSEMASLAAIRAERERAEERRAFAEQLHVRSACIVRRPCRTAQC